MFYLGLSDFLGLQSTAPATKNEPGASKALHLPHGILIMSKIKFDDGFAKQGARPFQNAVQVHQILRLALKVTTKTTSHFDPRLQTF